MAEWQRNAAYTVRVRFEEDPAVHTFLYLLKSGQGLAIRKIVRAYLELKKHDALKPEVQQRVRRDALKQQAEDNVAAAGSLPDFDIAGLGSTDAASGNGSTPAASAQPPSGRRAGKVQGTLSHLAQDD